MAKFFTFLICFALASSLLAQGQIRTKSTLGVEDLVRNVFIRSGCRNVSNISGIGNEIISIGQFENGGNIIGITDGIILSTGDINLAPGPNNNNEAGFALNDLSNDLDLDQLATSTLFDVTGIEFDFVPLGDRVTFRYVFASEEYCEFVGTEFNDVFGFFVSGPGINGTFDNNAINIATLAGTDDEVAINSINHLQNSNFYVNNATNINTDNCGITSTAAAPAFIEYDGFTTPLLATIGVVPCETYRIRLVIGDVGDPILDSAVFLGGNSFDIGAPVLVTAQVPGSIEPIAFENCVDGEFVFQRSGGSLFNQDEIIEFSISPDSEAINGVDFEEIPLSVTIPAGQVSATLPINIIEDNILEGPENLKLEIRYQCDCIDPTGSELIINDDNDLALNFEEITVCAEQPFSVTPEILGGVPPFGFLWNTGVDTETMQGLITESTEYTLTITDFCGNTSLGVANIEVQNLPTATLTGDFNLCETTETGIPVELEGNPPWTIGYSIDGVEQVPIGNIQSSPFFLDTPTDGTYLITAFNDEFCTGNVMGIAEVESSFVVDAEVIPPVCFNSSDGSIEVTQLEAIPPFTTEWSIETEDDFFLDNLEEGTYTLTIVNGDGCIFEETIDLTATSVDFTECAQIFIPNVFSPNDDGINDIFSIFVDDNSGIENIISMQVFNRWGALMFEQNNFIPDNGNTGWNGDFKERPLNPGVYVYIINIAFEDGNTLLRSGDVTLLR